MKVARLDFSDQAAASVSLEVTARKRSVSEPVPDWARSSDGVPSAPFTATLDITPVNDAPQLLGAVPTATNDKTSLNPFAMVANLLPAIVLGEARHHTDIASRSFLFTASDSGGYIDAWAPAIVSVNVGPSVSDNVGDNYAALDRDGDQIPDLIEYALGLSPDFQCDAAGGRGDDAD